MSVFRSTPELGDTIRQNLVVPVENVRPAAGTLAVSDRSCVIISTLPFSLTRSRGENLRVVGILEMVE